MGYLKKKVVVNIYGEKVTLYAYSGKPFPYVSDYSFLQDLGANVENLKKEEK